MGEPASAADTRMGCSKTGGDGSSSQIVESNLHMGFFTFSYGFINLGYLLAGTIIILIAWIMDEGRKIQEEQELTV
jgi:hypothetical protein